MRKYLIGAAALLGLAAGLRHLLRKSKEHEQERHFGVLRQLLGIQPGVKEEKSDCGVVSQTVAAQKKSPGTALMLHPDANGLRVNGSWLTTMNLTIEPEPIHATRKQVNSALERARKHIASCETARRNHQWEEAQKHVDNAVAEVELGLRRDHWFRAEMLNQQACLAFERGKFVEAREIWWAAEEVCEEWPDRCKLIATTIQENLERVRGELGF